MWWQLLYCVEVRKQRQKGTHFAHTFLVQSKAAAHVMVLPTFKVDLLQHH